MNNYFLSIDKEYMNPKQEPHIRKIIRMYKGEIDGASEYALVFSFPDKNMQDATNDALYRFGVCASIVVNAN